MPLPSIDLRRLRDKLNGQVTPENELPLARRNFSEGGAAPEEKLLQTEAAAHPHGTDEDEHIPPLLEWTAYEFEPDPASAVLQLLAGSGLALGGVVAAIFGNFLFALLLGLAGGLVITHAYRSPRQIRFAVTERGIEIGNRRYEFDDLEHFTILYDPPLFRDLALHSKKTIMPKIRAPLGELDPLQLRRVLLRFLAEEVEEPSLVDIIARRLGF